MSQKTPSGREPREPAMQNIPIRTELGRRIRAAFKPELNPALVNINYSELELRALASKVQP